MPRHPNKPNQIVVVDQLVKRYKKASVNAVNGVSFYVEKGSFFALLGPNGAGKTTIISILTSTLAKTSGTATVAGHEVGDDPLGVRKNIGVIFQNPSLDENLTAEENVRFHVSLYGLYTYRPAFRFMPQEYQRKARDLAEVLGIQEQLFDPVKSLSGGMKRKLEIVRSLMHSPKVLFLDEPTTGLDPISRNNLWQYLQGIRQREKVTIFLTTHYLEEAESADYVCMINHGRIVAQGTPRQVKEELVESYLELDADDRRRLESELNHHSLRFDGRGPFRLPLQNGSAQSIISRVKTPLTVLSIHDPTLEEAYLKIIGNSSQPVS